MPIYRDFKKGDARRDMLVLSVLAVKRTVPATATELEISKSECMAAIARMPQFGVELKKEEGDPEWTIHSWGVLDPRAVKKLLAAYDPAAEAASAPPATKRTAAKAKAPAAKKSSAAAKTKPAPAKKASAAKGKS